MFSPHGGAASKELNESFLCPQIMMNTGHQCGNPTVSISISFVCLFFQTYLNILSSLFSMIVWWVYNMASFPSQCISSSRRHLTHAESPAPLRWEHVLIISQHILARLIFWNPLFICVMLQWKNSNRSARYTRGFAQILILIELVFKCKSSFSSLTCFPQSAQQDCHT